MRSFSPRRGLALATLALGASMFFSSTAAAQAIDTCGTLDFTVLEPCLVFQPDGGGPSYLLDDLGGFGPGDSVHVVGTVDPNCIGFCFVACVATTSVSACDITTDFCFGDGSATACPCGNVGGAGRGCANSASSGAFMTFGGTPSVVADDLSVTAHGLPASQPALLIAGDTQVNGGMGTLFGDGLRCVGGNVLRLSVVAADSSGDASYGPGIVSAAGWTPGVVTELQVWYRDPIGSPCAAGFNLSHASELTLAP